MAPCGIGKTAPWLADEQFIMNLQREPCSDDTLCTTAQQTVATYCGQGALRLNRDVMCPYELTVGTIVAIFRDPSLTSP
jgi:hypothetical protein